MRHTVTFFQWEGVCVQNSGVSVAPYMGNFNFRLKRRYTMLWWYLDMGMITWPFVSKIHRSLLDSPRKGPITRSFTNSLSYVWTSSWTNNWVPGDFWDVMTLMWRRCNDFFSRISSSLWPWPTALSRWLVYSRACPLWPLWPVSRWLGWKRLWWVAKACCKEPLISTFGMIKNN